MAWLLPGCQFEVGILAPLPADASPSPVGDELPVFDAQLASDPDAGYPADAGPMPPAEIRVPGFEGYHRFGCSVAVSGQVLAIASCGEDVIADTELGDEEVPTGGAVRLYRWDDSQWIEDGFVSASDAGSFGQFGASLALAGDRLAVGAPCQGYQGHCSGAVYIFERDASGWDEVAYLYAPDGATETRFGSAVALSADTLAVAAAGTGASYVLYYADGNWQQQAAIPAPGPWPMSGAYQSVALRGDTLVIGAAHSRLVRLFGRVDTVWSERATFAPTSDVPLAEQWGASVALANDVLVIGAPITGAEADVAQCEPELESHGAAYVFDRVGDDWVRSQRLTSSGAAGCDAFAVDVAVWGDSGTVQHIAVGAMSETSGDDGAVWMFQRTKESWIEHAALATSSPLSGERFGSPVALGDGVVAVGARALARDPSHQGAVYVFQ